MKKNKHGYWVENYPLRFRSLEEVEAYQQGKIDAGALPQPFVLCNGKVTINPEYLNAPFERGLVFSPQIFDAKA